MFHVLIGCFHVTHAPQPLHTVSLRTQALTLTLVGLLYMPCARQLLGTFAPTVNPELVGDGCMHVDQYNQTCCLMLDPVKPCIYSDDWDGFTTLQFVAMPLFVLCVWGLRCVLLALEQMFTSCCLRFCLCLCFFVLPFCFLCRFVIALPIVMVRTIHSGVREVTLQYKFKRDGLREDIAQLDLRIKVGVGHRVATLAPFEVMEGRTSTRLSHAVVWLWLVRVSLGACCRRNHLAQSARKCVQRSRTFDNSRRSCAWGCDGGSSVC